MIEVRAMPILMSDLVDKTPSCPKCGNKYQRKINKIEEYGAYEDGYWFKYLCQNCTTKKKNVFVKYFTDKDFKLIEKK